MNLILKKIQTKQLIYFYYYKFCIRRQKWIFMVVIFIKYYIKNEVLEIFKLSYISLISAVLSIVIEKIIKTETFSLFIILLSIIINIWKLFTDNKHKNEKLNFFEIESKKNKI